MSNKTSIELIKQLREETQAPVMEIKKALEKAKGNFALAKNYLKEYSIQKAAKKAGEKTSEGIVESYIHQNYKVGSLIALTCQTDFVARTEEFKKLAHEIAMQVASMDPKNVNTLLDQAYIRDQKRKIKDLIDEMIGKLGENIEVKEITRFAI